VVDTFAGGKIPSSAVGSTYSGTYGDTGGVTWDGAGNAVFCDQTYNVVRRIRPNGSIETIAGTGVFGFGGDSGPAVNALLNSPRTPRYDSAGNLYFFDNARIRRVDTHGIITTVAGVGEYLPYAVPPDGPATQRWISTIADMVVDNSRNIYFSADNNIFRVTAAGELQNLGIQTSSSGSLAIDPSGNLYLFDTNRVPNLIRRAPSGVTSVFATFPNPNPYGFINTGLKASSAVIFATVGGNAYQIDFEANMAPTTMPQGLPFPSSIDKDGNLLLVSTITPDAYVGVPVIQELTAQGDLKTLAGGHPSQAPDGTPLQDAWFLNPTSIAFSKSGDLYIAEFGACLIRKIGADGVLSTFAGTGTCGYPAPSGNAKTANLVYPVSIAVDSKNRVWVSDFFNNLYSISQDGTLSKIVPTPATGGKGRIAIDSKDRVYVIGMNSLYRVLPDGSNQAIVPPPGTASRPPDAPTTLNALGVDPSGNVYFFAFNNYYVVNDDGTYTVKGSVPTESPNSLAIDSAGNVWGAEGGIIKHNLRTNPPSLAVLGISTGFSGDGGPAISAGYSNASSPAFAPNGDLYFVDSNRIRRITGSVPSSAPVISQNGIVNAASFSPGPVAPGELISIFGSGFGTSSLQIASPVNNATPFTLGRTRVLFNGYASAITAITPNQINVFVPSMDLSSYSVTVQVDDAVSAPVLIPVAPTAPGLSTLNRSGSGPGAILNQDGSINSAANPAAAGSVISLFGTGVGLMNPRWPSGALVISPPFGQPVNPVSVQIGGQNAVVTYAGDAPWLPSGVFQINANIPANVESGAADVSVSAGGFSSTQRVTVSVRH
jgi:uncharacterized protein (TIGR03437 family)